MPLPFPLQPDLGNLAGCRGAGVPARGPTNHSPQYLGDRLSKVLRGAALTDAARRQRATTGLGPNAER
jgi:hypothetical protein